MHDEEVPLRSRMFRGTHKPKATAFHIPDAIVFPGDALVGSMSLLYSVMLTATQPEMPGGIRPHAEKSSTNERNFDLRLIYLPFKILFSFVLFRNKYNLAYIFRKKRLKIRKGQSEDVNRRKTDKFN